MKHIMIVAIILTALCCFADPRIWTSRTGKTVKADFIKIENDVVYLRHITNGKTIKIKKSKLSDKDLEFLAWETLDVEKTYKTIKGQISLLSSTAYYSNSDKSTATSLILLYKEWIKVYQKNPKDARRAYKKCFADIQNLLKEKDIIAYKYNEFLKREVEVPVQFNLFTNSNDFYFKIGDGDFSTIASVSLKQLLELQKAITKIQGWKQQCREQKLNARKDVGRFGGINLEFVSKDKGKNIYVWMTAKGAWAKDRMITEQTVRLTPLNISAIYFHIGRASELYKAREEEKRNAEKLK